MTYYSGIGHIKYLHFPLSFPHNVGTLNTYYVMLLTYYSGISNVKYLHFSFPHNFGRLY